MGSEEKKRKTPVLFMRVISTSTFQQVTTCHLAKATISETCWKVLVLVHSARTPTTSSVVFTPSGSGTVKV